MAEALFPDGKVEPYTKYLWYATLHYYAEK
jgi:hypothetical protein